MNTVTKKERRKTRNNKTRMNKWVNKYTCYWKTVTIQQKGSNVLALLCVRHNDNTNNSLNKAQ